MGVQGQTTVDFTSTPADSGTFTVVNAAFSGLTFAEAFFMRDSTASNSVDEHEQAASATRLSCSVSGNTLTIFIDVIIGYLTDQFVVRYVVN